MAIATHGEIPASIQDAKVYPYAGGVPGTMKDVPGIRRVEMEASVETEEHRGDDKIIATTASFNSIDTTIEVGQLNLDALAALAGGVVTVSGVAPNQVRTLQRKTTDVVADYQIKAQTASRTADGGAFRLVLPRCQWQGGPSYSMADNEFATAEITAKAIPGAGDLLYSYEQFETSVAIS